MSVQTGLNFSSAPDVDAVLDGGIIGLDGFGTDITIPDVGLLLEGQYRRAGDDLEITGTDGKVWIIDDYFSMSPSPVLLAPNGALLLPETVTALLVVDPKAGATMVAGPTMVAEVTSVPNAIGKVGQMVGKVMAKGVDGIERTVKEGDAIFKGDVLQTQKGGLVKLVFADGTSFQLGEEARAVIDKYIFDPAAKLGGFEATVTKGIFSFESGGISGLNAGRHSAIKTPTAVIGIRGSQLSGEVTDDGSTTVVHTQGILDISDARGQGTVTLVEPGTATQVVFGAGAPEPVFKAPASFVTRLEGQLDIQKAKEERKSEESGDSNNKQEQKPEGKKEAAEGDQGQAEGKTEGGQGEKKADDAKESEAEKQEDAEGVSDAEGIADAEPVDASGEGNADGTSQKNLDSAANEAAAGGASVPDPASGTATGGIGDSGGDAGGITLADLIGTGGALEGADVLVGAVGETLSTLVASVSALPTVPVRTDLPVSQPSVPVVIQVKSEPKGDSPAKELEPTKESGPQPESQGDGSLTLGDLLGNTQDTATPELTSDMLSGKETTPEPAPQTPSVTVPQTEVPRPHPGSEASPPPTVTPSPAPAPTPEPPAPTPDPPAPTPDPPAPTPEPPPPPPHVNHAPTGSVTISGSLVQGQTLTVVSTLADSDGLGSIGYQWQADDRDLSEATGSTLLLTESLVGKTIKVTASYVDGHGASERVASNATGNVANLNDTPTGSVIIRGSAVQNATLTATHTLEDADGMGTVGYRWQANGVDIANATGNTMVLMEAQVGKIITVVAAYTDGHGTLEGVTSGATGVVGNVNESPAGLVTIGGTVIQGATLTAANTLADTDGLGTISYRWQANGVDITNATGQTLVLSGSQVGKTIGVVASYTDGHGTDERVASTATGSVTNAITISGTATKGYTLAVVNNLASVSGISLIGYQWQADGSDIGGATGSTLVLSSREVGKAVTVTANYSGPSGTPERISSSATAPVENFNYPPTAVSNTLTTNEDTALVLSASNFGFSDVDSPAMTAVTITSSVTYGALQTSSNASLIDGSLWTNVSANQVISKAVLDAGGLRFSPAAHASGTPYAQFGFKVSDGTDDSVNAYTMTVNVTPVNDNPSSVHSSISVPRGIISKTISSSDLRADDVDNTPAQVTFTLASLPSAGTLSRSGNSLAVGSTFTQADIDSGFVTYTHSGGTATTDSFEYTLSDGVGGVASGNIFNVNVFPANPPTSLQLNPAAGAGSFTVAPGNALVGGLGGSTGYGEEVFSASDDTYWPRDVSSVFENGFNFLGTNYSASTGFFVGSNGYVTFGTGSSSFTNWTMAASSIPMVAGLFCDIDTRKGGFVAFDVDTASPTQVVTITYANVAPYSTTYGGSGANSFQIRLHDLGSGSFGVELRYASMGWDGYAATAGWTAGSNRGYDNVPGSGSTMLNAPTVSNFNHPGVDAWIISNTATVGDGGQGRVQMVEGASAGTIVALLSAQDPDANETLTYSLTNNDSGHFSILNNNGTYFLRVENGSDILYSQATSRTVGIRVTDSTGLYYETNAQIQVNQKVTSTSGGAVSILEDSPAPQEANIRVTPATLVDSSSGLSATQARIVSVTGGVLTQGSDGAAIAVGSSGTLLSLTDGHLDLRFTPSANRDVDVTFEYALVNPANTAVNFGSTVAGIVMTGVNDAPSSGGDVTVTDTNNVAVSILEDSSASTAANIRLTVASLWDVDAWQTPSAVRIVSVTGGTLLQGDGSAITLGTDGSRLSLTNKHLDLRFTPELNRDYSATFQYVVVDAGDSTVNSASSTATVAITAVDDSPVASDISVSTNNGQDVEVELFATDVDQHEGGLYYIYTQPSHGTLTGDGSSLIYTPSGTWSGTDTFTYYADDGYSNSNQATGTITVNSLYNPVGEWLFSGNANDRVSGYHGVVVNATATSNRNQISDQAYHFASGVDDYIRVDMDVNPGNMTSMTMTAWVKADTPNGGVQTILSHDDGGHDRGLGIEMVDGVGKWSVYTGGSGTGVLTATEAVVGSDWTFLSVVYDGSTNTVELFVNGYLFDSSSTDMGAGLPYFYLGKNPTLGAEFNGTIDDVRVYDRGMTAEEINALFNSGTTDPIVFDTNGDGIHLQTGPGLDIRFAMSPDGRVIPSAWLDSTDGFLVLDKNANGQVDDITELFSKFFVSGASTGMEALATLDVNGDCVLDGRDQDFSRLALWQDANSNGVTDSGELTNLAQRQIDHISLASEKVNEVVNGGLILSKGTATSVDGSAVHFAEVGLNDLEWATPEEPSGTQDKGIASGDMFEKQFVALMESIEQSVPKGSDDPQGVFNLLQEINGQSPNLWPAGSSDLVEQAHAHLYGDDGNSLSPTDGEAKDYGMSPFLVDSHDLWAHANAVM